MAGETRLGRLRRMLPALVIVIGLGLSLSASLAFAGLSAIKLPAPVGAPPAKVGSPPLVSVVEVPVGAIEGAGPAHPDQVLYDQYNSAGQNAVTSQNFEAQYDAYDAQAADNFAVPQGQTWAVDLVEVAGTYQRGTGGPAESVSVFFYASTASLPGTPVFTQTNLAFEPGSNPGDLVIAPDPPAILPEGDYWLSVQANQSYDPSGQWFWRNRTATSYSSAAWRNPGGGFITPGSCLSWGSRSFTCFREIPAPQPDQVFRLSGSAGGSPTPTLTGTPPTPTRTRTPVPTFTATPPTVTHTGTSTGTRTNTGTITPTPYCLGTWQVVPIPTAGTYYNYLYDVAVISDTDAWAVGHYSTLGTEQTLVEHWDGSTWNVVSSPNAGDDVNRLTDVDGTATDDVWTVGDYRQGNAVRTLAMHWDGAQWSIVPSPNAGAMSSLEGIAMLSADDGWAVGNYYDGGVRKSLTMHWDGKQWTLVPGPNPGTVLNELAGVTAIATNDVWAVGNYSNGGPRQALIMRWDGSQWSLAPVPSLPPGGSRHLLGVSAISATDIWAVGQGVGNERVSRTLTMRWNGAAWNVVPSANLGDESTPNILMAVAAISANDVWAAGLHFPDPTGFRRKIVLEHWNGSHWSPAAHPVGDSGEDLLTGLAALSGDYVWAAGHRGETRPLQGLVLRYDGPCSSPTLTPTRTTTSTPTTTRTRTATPLHTPCSTCNLTITRVAISCNPDGTVHWVSTVRNNSSCTVNTTWKSQLQVHVPGTGGYTVARTATGPGGFPPGTSTISGDFCYQSPPNANVLRVEFKLDAASGRCMPRKKSQSRTPCNPPDPCTGAIRELRLVIPHQKYGGR